MKKLTILLLLLAQLTMQAQQGFKWQGLAKDAQGNAVTQPVTLTFTILQNNAAVYAETHAPITPVEGQLTANVGMGTPMQGVFADIDWSVANTSLNVKMKVGNGAVVDMGTSDVLFNARAVWATKTSSYFDGPDLVLGINDNRPMGLKTQQRALVHDVTGDVLALNYFGDFEGGVRVDSKLSANGLKSNGPIDIDLTYSSGIQGREGLYLYASQDNNAGLIVVNKPKLAIWSSSNNSPTNFESGDASVRILEIRGGSDITEKVNSPEALQPGEVIVTDPTQPNSVRRSSRAYDRTVLGVVSGAGGVSHGMELKQEGLLDGNTSFAIAGRVYVKTIGRVAPGDLLTTSDVPGHAMKATNRRKRDGAVIGKALSEPDENGLVLMVVNLQ